MGGDLFSSQTALGVGQAVAFTVGFEDVNAMGQPVQHGPGEPFAAQHLRPVFKRQVGGDDEAGTLISTGHHIEEQFGPGLGERDVAEFVEDEQIEPFELFVEPLEQPVLAHLQKQCHQRCGGGEPHPLARRARGKAQGGGQVGLARAGVANQQHVVMEKPSMGYLATRNLIESAQKPRAWGSW